MRTRNFRRAAMPSRATCGEKLVCTARVSRAARDDDVVRNARAPLDARGRRRGGLRRAFGERAPSRMVKQSDFGRRAEVEPRSLRPFAHTENPLGRKFSRIFASPKIVRCSVTNQPRNFYFDRVSPVIPEISLENPLWRRAKAVQPTSRQNKKSTKQREKPRAVISCDAMTTMRDGVLEF